MAADSRPAGWYDDEVDADAIRYWDGSAWTPHTAPKRADAAAAGSSMFSARTPTPVEPIAPQAAASAVPARRVDDSIDELTSLRSAWPSARAATTPPAMLATDLKEHTTVPLPPENVGPVTSAPHFTYDTYRGAGRSRVAWIVTGAIVALGLVMGTVTAIVGAMAW